MELVRVLPLAFVAATADMVPRPASAQAGPLGVFLDCRGGCDSQYIRTEISFVNWLRDRAVADVHVLITSQDAGAGGDAYTLAFIGLRAYAGRADTLTYTSNPTTTDDEERQGLTRTLAAGLAPFVARAGGAQALRISSAPQIDARGPGTQTMPANDPWKAWVFEIDVRGDVGGEQNYRNLELDTEVNANRTTEAWKVAFGASLNTERERVIDDDFDDDGNLVSSDTVTNNQQNWNTEFLLVKSVTGHLSTGFRAAVSSSRFRNQKRRIEFMPAVEYNIFPYSEFTRRRLALQVGAGVDDFVYNDTTIFDKLKETFPMYFAAAIYATRQPWGSSGLRLEHRGYTNDLSKRSTDLSGDVSVRIFQGLSVRFGGGYEWIHDQVYLPKGDRDQADLLLRRRALLTGFEYNAFVGLTYTFGSIFNNVVNPRFF
ncbi:MAG TPA: hypothetical protein VF981_08095 [Gemmatimonadaceae bacterium]